MQMGLFDFLRKIQRTKGKSLKEVVEKENPNVEHAYIKFPREKPISVSLKENPKSVEYDYTKMRKEWKRYDNKQYTMVHTHPSNDKVTKKEGILYGTLPSKDDIRGFLSDDNAKSMVVVQQNKDTGKVEGYFVLKKTKNTPLSGVSPVETKKEIKKKFSGKKGFFRRSQAQSKQRGIKIDTNKYGHGIFDSVRTGDSKYQTQALEELKDEYKLKSRFVPAKGYEIDKDVNKFKKKVGLEGILVVGFIAIFISYLVFFAPKVTGFVIYHNQPPEVGVPFFILFAILIFCLMEDSIKEI